MTFSSDKCRRYSITGQRVRSSLSGFLEGGLDDDIARFLSPIDSRKDDIRPVTYWLNGRLMKLTAVRTSQVPNLDLVLSEDEEYWIIQNPEELTRSKTNSDRAHEMPPAFLVVEASLPSVEEWTNRFPTCRNTVSKESPQ